MKDPAFFGYGSLVNLATHDYANPRPARLVGWRRVWRHSTLRDVAYLSVEPAPGHAIDGIVADVPGSDWTALDHRERAYSRIDVSETLGVSQPTAVYRVSDGHIAPPDTRHPVLLSYIDTVVQGYLHVFGAEGPAHFFDTTDGWDVPVLNDRHAPIYPRHQRLSDGERAVVDDWMSRLPARVQVAE